jgi:hypothetical protein
VELPKRVRYFVMNHRSQPLELHLSGGVVVLDSHQEKEIRETDLESAQLRVFRKQRLVSVREVADPVAHVEPAKPAEPERSAAATPTEKPEGVKRRGTGKKEG